MISDSNLDFDLHSVNCHLSNGSGSSIDTNNFKIVFFNVNSILAPESLVQLSGVILILKINVLVIAESKFCATTRTHFFTPFWAKKEQKDFTFIFIPDLVRIMTQNIYILQGLRLYFKIFYVISQNANIMF